MQLVKNVQPIVKWIFISIVVCGLIGCSSVATGFSPVEDSKNHFTINVAGDSSKSTELALVEEKAKAFAAEHGYTSYEILPYPQPKLGSALLGDGIAAAAMIFMGTPREQYDMYTVIFKR